MYSSSIVNEKQLEELDRIIQQKIGRNYKSPIEIIKKTKKNQQQFYIDLSFTKKETDLSNIDIEDLVNKNLLKIISKKEKTFIPTLKALLMIYYKIAKPDNHVNSLLEDLNKKFFENILELSEELLTSKEKAIILALIGIGAISPSYSLKLNEANEEAFKKCVDIAAEFLASLGKEFDDGTLSKLWNRNVIGETPVRAEMRRLNTIQPHTEGMYRKEGNNNHYLDLLDKGELNQESLAYLFERIFDKRTLSFEERKKLIATLDEIQQYEFKIIKVEAPYDRFEIKTQIKHFIESRI